MARRWIGEPDSRGRALALVHGAGGTHTLWGEVFGRLRREDIPAIALDLPGHGASPGPAPSSVAAFAAATVSLLAEAGATTFAVAGHSLGGAVALTLAAAAVPGVLGAGAVSSGVRLPVDSRILRGTRDAFACTVGNLAKFLFARGAPPERIEEAATMMSAAGPEALHADFAACAAYGLSAQELGGIAVPVEVVCGDADVLTPMALSEEVVAAVPGARLTRVPGAGHMPLLEAPDAVAEALARLWSRVLES